METPEEFLVVLNTAFATQDGATLAARLSQLTIDIYGAEGCDAYFTGIFANPQPQLTMREVLGVGNWDYVIDGITTAVPDATSVEVSREVDGQTVIQELHWQLVDGRYTWFTDCGEPLPA